MDLEIHWFRSNPANVFGGWVMLNRFHFISMLFFCKRDGLHSDDFVSNRWF